MARVDKYKARVKAAIKAVADASVSTPGPGMGPGAATGAAAGAYGAYGGPLYPLMGPEVRFYLKLHGWHGLLVDPTSGRVAPWDR